MGVLQRDTRGLAYCLGDDMREPDFVIGPTDNPYMLRWWIIPRNKYFNIYLHKILRDDDDRALHDHPWPSLSWLLKGQLVEQLPDTHRTLRRSIFPVYRSSLFRHRLELPADSATTLFITGPRLRNWGFWCEGTRFVPWEEFVNADNPGETGRGCGEM